MLVGCAADDVESVYARRYAYFEYNKATSVQPLNSALNGPGHYCCIYLQGNNLMFTSLTNSYPDPVTAQALYQRFVSVDGFIVGLSNVTDMISGVTPVLCFDRVCRNCYEQSSITRPVSLQENGRAHCSRCNRTYDLNNLGIVVDGEKGSKLYRYRIYYGGGDHLLINNPGK